MKQLALLALSAFMVAACGGVDESGSEELTDPIASTSEALFNLWTPSVSEETGPNGTTCGTDQVGATRAMCSGRYCDNMRLFCGALPHSFVKTATGNWWSAFVSEQGGISANCPAGWIADGIRAQGSYAASVGIHCSPVSWPAQGTRCKWMPYFSEEQGSQVFDVDAMSSTGAVAIGVRCSGDYCDNMSYLVCEPKCRTNADCFGACVNGTCTVG